MSISLSEFEPITGSLTTCIATPALAAELALAQAEAASLRSQLAELRMLAVIPEHNPNPVVQFDAPGRQLYANPAARCLREGLSRADQVRVRQQLRAVVQTGLADQHIRVGERYFMLSAVSTAPPAGSTTLYLAETTERVLAERRLAEQQVFIQEILDTTPSPIFVRDNTGTLVFENRAATELRDQLGYLRAEGAQPPTARQAAERTRYLASDAQVLATGEQLTNENGITLASGEVRYFHIVKRPLRRADGTWQVLGVSTDITVQKLASQALAQREKLYRDLMTYSQAFICTHDLEGYLLSANPAAAVLLGRPLAELPGQHLTQVCLYKQRDLAEQYLAYIDEVGSLRGTTGFIRPGGQRRYLLHDNHVVREPGQPPYVIVYGQDVTEQQLAERELKRAKAAAEAAVTARENFLANMSHEIRTPLNGVLGMAAQLAKTTLDVRQRDFVHTIRRSGQHLLHVINDVLDVAKINSDKLELERMAFHLPDSIEQLVAPLALQAQQKGLAFAFEHLALASPWVLSDPFRLNQVLLNLLANAIKFTERGGVTLRVALLAEADELLHLEFRVEDTGIGIAPEALARIFESFTQAQPDTARRYGGSGLGLTISRALVQQLGGELVVTSTPGQGSCFTFGLPLRKAEPRPASLAPLDAFDTGQLRGTRMLLAEDNLINRTVARLHLLHWGVVVDEVPDGPAALQLLEQHAYDVVLMDIQMPGMSGLDVTRRLRQHPDPMRAATPMLALTANAFRSNTEQYLAAGFHDFLTKPFAEEQLYAKLVALLRQPAPPAAPPRPYDLTRLRREARGHAAFVAGMVTSFLTHMPPTLQALRAASEARNWPQVAELVHHIKPNLLALSIEGALAPVLTLEEPPLLQPAPDELVRQAAVQQLLALVENALRELPAELAPAQ